MRDGGRAYVLIGIASEQKLVPGKIPVIFDIDAEFFAI